MTNAQGPSPPTYPQGCTFAEADWACLSRQWFPVAVAAEVDDAPVAARLLDVDLVLFRGEGGPVVVARDRCPHRGMRLSLGVVAEGQIVCPYHGLHFDGGGRCVAIPSQPGAVIPDRLALDILPTVERFGLIWTSFASGTPALPDFPAWDDPGFQTIVCPVVDIAGAAGRQVEGFLDVAHFAWAHTTTFGDRNNPIVPDYTVGRTKAGLKVEYISNVSNYGPSQRHLAPPDFRWRRTFEVFPPFSARLVVDFPADGQLWILNAASPVSARRTRLFCPLARNVDLDTPVEMVRAFNLKVFNEDRVMVENQQPQDLPLDGGGEVHIAADRASVAYRRLLRQMGLSLTCSG
jgi:vanillate O-demethylase monooxygenase subunit